MTAVTYTAAREVIAGHIVDTEYTIDLRLITLDRGKDVRKEPSVSMSGNTETVLWRNLKTWKVTTGAVRWEQLGLVREFLESVIAGETFQYDEFGSADAPFDPISCVVDGVYSEDRAIRKGGDSGRNDYFRFTFSIRQVP